MLKRIIPVMKDYEYLRREEVMSENGNITFSFNLKESFHINGKPVTDEHNEVWVLSKIGSTYKIREVFVSY